MHIYIELLQEESLLLQALLILKDGFKM